MNVPGDGMKKDVFFCLMTIIHYCISARINRLIRIFDSSSSSSPLDFSTFFDGAVVPTGLGVVVFVFFRPRWRRRVVGFSAFGMTIGPLGTFGIPSFTDGAVPPPAGRAGVTALTFEAIHPKLKTNRS